jgi:glycerol-3-phosphate O-acyltransferase
VAHYLSFNIVRLLSGSLKRYGRVAVSFGTPVSVRDWAASHPAILAQTREERSQELAALARLVLERIAAIMPVTPVPLVAAALLSFHETFVDTTALLERLGEYGNHLRKTGCVLSPAELDASAMLDRAWRMLTMRRLAVREGQAIVVLPAQRPLLEFYANSIAHLLPAHERLFAMTPALDPDETLPRLQPLPVRPPTI